MPDSEIHIGFDLGGSFLKAAAFALDGTLRKSLSRDTSQCHKAGDYVDLLREAAACLSENARPRGIGIAVAGVLDLDAGRVVDSPNLPALRDFRLLEALQDAFSSVPVRMINDASAAALGEYFAGAGAGCRSMFIMTLGTGVGGGFVQDGELWGGASGMAGEIGHMVIERDGKLCNCGSRGCLEAYFSGWSLIRDAQAHARRQPDSAIGSLDEISPVSLAELAASGDQAAKALWEGGGRALGIGIANVMNLLNPESIVLVGGLGNAREHFWPSAQSALQESAFEQARDSSKVCWGLLGGWAGARGAIQSFL